jgi:hypothetical protein
MLIDIPDKNMEIEFPDDMSDAEVTKQIRVHVYGEKINDGYFVPEEELPKPKWSRDKSAYEASPYKPELFDPEGTGYDYESAKSAGLSQDETGHWPSRNPKTGQILKGRGHETFSLTEQGEKEAGYKIEKGSDGKYYSQKPKEDKNILAYAPYMAVKALKGLMGPLLPILKRDPIEIDGKMTQGMDTEAVLNTAIEYWQKQLPDVGIPNAGIVFDENGDLDIQQIDDVPISEIIGGVAEGAGFLGPASVALKGGGLVAEKLSQYARPFYRNILKGMIGGSLLGEGKKDETLEHMAMFGVFEGAGYAIGKIPDAVKAVKDSTMYRKATIKERGLVIQSLEETLNKNPNISEADLVRASDTYFKQAMAKRQAGEIISKEDAAELKKVETNPSDAQAEAGNYKKAHIKVDGFDLSIENPAGSTRSGVDASGKEWSQKMFSHYGYLKRSLGKDGDQVDVFINPKGKEGKEIFVVDQVDPKTNKFDEHKVMIGYDSKEDAKQAYLSNYEDGWKGLGNISGMSQETFKAWLNDSKRTKKPVVNVLEKKKPETKAETKTETKESQKEKTEIVTDPATVQKIKNSIAEGELILRAGTSNGKKLSNPELAAVQRSVDNAKVKIGIESEVKKETEQDHIFLQKLDTMQQEVNSTHTRGFNQAKPNQPGEDIGYSANSPQWMQWMQAERKVDKKPALTRNDLNALFNNIRSGKPLTTRQQDQYIYLERAIEKYAGETQEFTAGEEATDLENRGFDPMGGAKVSVASLNEGDKFVGTVDGVKDEFTVKDTNAQGETLLEDGIKKRVDMFDEVEVDGIKKGKKQPIKETQEPLFGEKFKEPEPEGQRDIFTGEATPDKKKPAKTQKVKSDGPVETQDGLDFGRDFRQEKDGQRTMFTPSGQEAIETVASEPRAAIESPRERKPLPVGKQRRELLKEVAAAFNVPIRTGKIRIRNAAGTYNQQSQVIRLKQANDIPVVAHEFGHHIQRLLGFPNKMPKEVQGLAYPGAKNIDREGFAEFVRYYTTESETAKKRAPQFYKQFEEALRENPDTKSIIDSVRQYWDEFQKTPSVDKVQSFVVSGTENKKRLPTLAEIYTEIKDNLHPIRMAVDVAKSKGATIETKNDPYQLARLTRGWARKADTFIRNRPFKYVGDGIEEIGKGLVEILAPIEKAGKRNAFDTYLVAKRAVNDNRIIKGFEGILSVNDFKQTVKELEPEFKQAADDLATYNNALLDYLVDSGRINKDLVSRIRADNLFYTPLYRLMDSETSFKGMGQKSGNTPNPIKKLKGSSRDIYSPTESILKNTYAIINSAERNKVGVALLDLSQVEGMGYLIERVPFDLKPESIRRDDFFKILNDYGEIQKVIDIKTSEKELSRDLNNLTSEEKSSSKMELVAKEALKTRGWSDSEANQVIQRIKGASSEKSGSIIEKTIEKTTIMTIKEELGFSGMPDSVVTTFRPNYKAGTNEVILYKNGKPYLVRFDPFLYKAVANLEAGEINMMIQIMAYPAKWLRAGATTFSPEFAIRNPMRDQMTSFIQSKYGFVPGYDFMRGIFHMFNQTHLWKEFNASGAAHSAIVSIDRNYLSKDLKHLLENEVKRFSKNPLEALQRISEYSEEATRVGEFARARKKGAKLHDAGMAARNVSLDFARQGGPSARAANMISAFWNARIEGLDRMARSFKERPAKTFMRAFLSVTLPSLLLWLYQKDDPIYQELPTWRKTLFWNFIIRDKEGKAHTYFFPMVPKPFEWGLLFGSLPIAALDWAYTKDPTLFKETIKQVGSTFDILPIPTGATPIVENWANKSKFFDRNIVPRDKEGLDPYLQYSGRTSETVKLATRLVKDVPGLKEVANPAKIENLINGYTAGFGRLALESSDWLLETFGAVKPPPDPAMTISDIPGLRAVSSRFPHSNARSIERFYNDYLREKQDWESKKQIWELRGKGIKGLNKLNPKLAQMEKVAKALSTLRRMADETYQAKGVTPDEKRDALNNIYYSMINVARGYYGRENIKQ